MNGWWTETHKREIRFQFNHTMNGYTKPYFTDETGRLFRDETGNLDNFDDIPFEVEFGRNNFNQDNRKSYVSVLADSEAAREMILQYSIDGGQYQTLGQLTDNISKFPFDTRTNFPEGGDISYKVVQSGGGDAPVFNGVSTVYTIQQRSINEGI